MAWTFEQATGRFCKDGEHIAYGYSGFGAGENQPRYECVPNVGPIPRGLWEIGSPFNSETHGPVVLPLTPRHEAYGRSAFLIHGDGVHNPGVASKGCIILDRPTRELIAVSEDRQLFVV